MGYLITYTYLFLEVDNYLVQIKIVRWATNLGQQEYNSNLVSFCNAI